MPYLGRTETTKGDPMIPADVKYGNTWKYDPDDWRATANPWTVTLKNGRRRMTVNYWTGSAITDDPTAADVLESLLSDANCAENGFDDFCAELGYDSDSRKAERIYRECVSIRRRLGQFLGVDFERMQYADRDEWPIDVQKADA